MTNLYLLHEISGIGYFLRFLVNFLYWQITQFSDLFNCVSLCLFNSQWVSSSKSRCYQVYNDLQESGILPGLYVHVGINGFRL